MNTKTHPAAPALILIAAIALYRIAVGFQPHPAWFENFAPVAAVALCGGAFLPRRFAIAMPLAALFISDILLNWHFKFPLVSPEMISRYLALLLIALLGFAFRNRSRLALFPAAIAGSFAFYVITNTSSWLTWPQYPKTLHGLFQALTTGLPGYPPTWSFYRSTFISDLLFTGLFLLCMAATSRHAQPAPAAAAQPDLPLPSTRG